MTEHLDAAFADWMSRRATTPGACPDSETLFAFAQGELTNADAQAACVAHLAGCDRCQRAVHLVLDTQSFASALADDLVVAESTQSADTVVRLPLPKRQPVRRWPLAMAAAAALLLTVLLVPWMQRPDYDTVRAPVNTLVLPPDQAVLTSAPDVLRWPCDPAVSEYTLSLLDAEAKVIWTHRVSQCEARLDPALFEQRQGSFFWRVSPGPAGAPEAVFAFSLEP